ncbi:MAG: hypothetical protein JWL92_82 [Candidatus Nomurabacteria bacterium]|nr:hypothetical protein [Candidatus Nomurabacteria bacterium]
MPSSLNNAEENIGTIDINEKEFEHSNVKEQVQGVNLEEKDNLISAQEMVFKSFIESRIYLLFEEGLNDNGYSPEEIDEIREHLDDFSVEEKKRILSLTHETKNRVLRTFKERMEKQGLPASDLVDTLKRLSDQFGFEVAYHCSDENITATSKKEFTGQNVEWVDSWKINGTEMDHRFDDKKMAYFSFDYEHLYRVKNPRYLYLVRVRTQNGTGFHTNIGNNWGTAQGLDIIDQIDLRKVDQFVDSLLQEYKNTQTKKDAA